MKQTKNPSQGTPQKHTGSLSERKNFTLYCSQVHYELVAAASQEGSMQTQGRKAAVLVFPEGESIVPGRNSETCRN